MMIAVFSRRRIAGYVWIVTSLVSVGFISFGVWVHHMFATGLPPLALAFFSAVSLLITIPSGGAVLRVDRRRCGRARSTSTVPMLFTVGFLLIFLLGGITGVMVSILPFDWAVTDSYFIVAHLHYVLNGAVVFPIFGAIYFWSPKMTGGCSTSGSGKISFWVMFIGFNLTFFPMHILGVLGMPRRVWTYSNGLGWDTLNLIVSIGSVVFGVGTGITLLNWAISMRRGRPAPADPWGADSLEWSVTSPPPEYNFAEIPIVSSRHPLWDDGVPPALPSLDDRRRRDDPAVRSLALEGALDKTSTITSGRDTRPSEVLEIPEQTVVPLVLAVGLAVFFVGLLIDASVVGVARRRDRGRRAAALGVAHRHGPDVRSRHDHVDDASAPRPACSRRRRPKRELLDRVVGHGDADRDRVDGLRHPARRVLLPARVVAAVAARRDRRRRSSGSRCRSASCCGGAASRSSTRRRPSGAARNADCGSGLLVSGVMGAAFLAFTLKDFHDLTFGWRDNAYGSIFYTIVGLHALHVFVGLCMNVWSQIKAWQGKFSAERHTTVEVFSLYWHFVDAVWIFVFLSLFLSEAWR